MGHIRHFSRLKDTLEALSLVEKTISKRASSLSISHFDDLYNDHASFVSEFLLYEFQKHSLSSHLVWHENALLKYKKESLVLYFLFNMNFRCYYSIYDLTSISTIVAASFPCLGSEDLRCFLLMNPTYKPNSEPCDIFGFKTIGDLRKEIYSPIRTLKIPNSQIQKYAIPPLNYHRYYSFLNSLFHSSLCKFE